MDNYEFSADWTAQRAWPGRALDFGCGAGNTVALLRAKEIDAYGCDAFYGDSTFNSHIRDDVRQYIRPMDGERIPFDDNSFDAVSSNMVFEHIVDLDFVCSEIHRVLQPGGTGIHLFPIRATWHEGHCGIPFLHWFSKGSKLRVYYAALLHKLGAGYHRDQREPIQWGRDQCAWLDEWTHYRSLRALNSIFRKYFEVTYVESEWLAGRTNYRIPSVLARPLVRATAGVAVVLRKPLK